MIVPSDAQKKLFDSLLDQKLPLSEHQNWRNHAKKDWDSFNRALAKLRSLRPLPEKAPASQEGLYRNPETGELYRLSRKSWHTIISKYSLTGGPRRLAADLSKIEKGKWVKYTAFQSRIALSKGEVLQSWLIDAKDLAVEYAYGFCPLHFGPLTDAVSVILGYGPDCARNHGLPWGEEVAQKKLDEMRKGRA